MPFWFLLYATLGDRSQKVENHGKIKFPKLDILQYLEHITNILHNLLNPNIQIDTKMPLEHQNI